MNTAGKLNFAMITVWILVVSLSMAKSDKRSRLMNEEPGVYCNGSVLTQVTTNSLECAMKCQMTTQCVAYSHRGDQCLLHAHFCSSQDKISEQQSLYSSEC